MCMLTAHSTAGCSIAKAVTADLKTFDGTYDLVIPAIWQLLEQNIGTCVACAPILRQLFNRKKSTTRPSGASSEKKGSGGNRRIAGRIREFWYDSAETTKVSHQTATSGADTLPIEDLEAGTARNPAKKGFARVGQNPEVRIEEQDVGDQIRSVPPVVETPEYVDIVEPMSARARDNRSASDQQGGRWTSSAGSQAFEQATLITPRSDRPLVSPPSHLPVRRLNEERREQPDETAPSLGNFPWEGPRAQSWYRPLWRTSSIFGRLDASASRHPPHSRANEYQMRWM